MRSLLMIGLCLLCGCDLAGPSIRGSGVLATQTRPIRDVSRISISGSSEVEIISGAEVPSCQISWDENLLPYVSTEVIEGELRIEIDGPRLASAQNLQVKIEIPSLEECRLNGHSSTVITGLDQRSFSANMSGSHRLQCSGQVGEVHLHCGGSGKILASELAAQQVTIDIAGSGAVDVQASESLSVKIAGSGTVQYAGQPRVTQEISGSGTVQQLQRAE